MELVTTINKPGQVRAHSFQINKYINKQAGTGVTMMHDLVITMMDRGGRGDELRCASVMPSCYTYGGGCVAVVHLFLGGQ